MGVLLSQHRGEEMGTKRVDNVCKVPQLIRDGAGIHTQAHGLQIRGSSPQRCWSSPLVRKIQTKVSEACTPHLRAQTQKGNSFGKERGSGMGRKFSLKKLFETVRMGEGQKGGREEESQAHFTLTWSPTWG